ncbi:MAG TPA: LacI family DNA-binding transcriptional regulator [Bryobacteraceae bacterium]|nr:LacI family DNA-binding transcriptional regulator [Bryobacteraceae bacterium]
MPTIKQVAKRAGVSIGTVSHVITGSVPVSHALRTKVESAIRELDYFPNHVARSLKTSRTRTLGIVVPDLTIPFFPRVIRGAEAAALDSGYSLISVTSDDHCGRQGDLLSLLRSQQVEGILLVVAAGETPTDQIARMMDSGTALVCLDRIPGELKVDSVSVDNANAAEMGVAHLISMGHRHIAIVTGSLSLRNEKERLDGYRQALRKAGLKLQDKLIWEGNFRPENIAAICRDRLSKLHSRPTALFATNGPTGFGVLRALHACGLRTPEDIGFATFDELALDDLFIPRVTTVVQPAYDIGYRAAAILLDRIQQRPKQPAPVTVRLPATLQVRESSRLVKRGKGVLEHA